MGKIIDIKISYRKWTQMVLTIIREFYFVQDQMKVLQSKNKSPFVEEYMLMNQ